MKKALFILLLAVFSSKAVSQTPGDYHFAVEGQKICWRQVFESPVDSLTVFDYLSGSGNFTDLAEISNGISFTIAPRKIDVRRAGLKISQVSMYILNYMMTAHGLIQLRAGRYRVSVDHILFYADPDTPLETYALSKQQDFKPVFMTMNAAQAIDFELTTLFTIKPIEEEDW